MGLVYAIGCQIYAAISPCFLQTIPAGDWFCPTCRVKEVNLNKSRRKVVQESSSSESSSSDSSSEDETVPWVLLNYVKISSGGYEIV